MPVADNDPRVFFAAERTLLAWLRSGLTVMALGFVIAGTLASLVSTIQHRRFIATLPMADLPRSYSGAFGFFISLAGLALALYLGVPEG